MAIDLLLSFGRANLVAGVAIILVLTLRTPARQSFGPHAAYVLWLVVPIAAAGSLMPAAITSAAPGAVETATDQLMTWLSFGAHAQDLWLIWAVGIGVSLALAGWRQLRFSAAVKAGRAGPAAVGVIQPHMVAPADFAQRFNDQERRLIRAHERAHMDRLDARYNALATFATWAFWFNPLVHLALRAMRIDQEVACDATVMQRLPTERRAYAETLLRSQLAASAVPVFGSQWAAHPLEARLRMLARRPASQARMDLGLAALGLLCLTLFAAAWAAQPPYRPAPTPLVIFMELTPPAMAGN